MIRLLLFLILLPGFVFSQFAYEVINTIPARNASTALSQAWAGGLNGVQVNKMDLNNDAQEDLVLFDRSANKVLTYLSVNNDFTYSPEYETFFPTDLNNFLLLRDYDGDGRKDIFTGNPFGIKVYKNTTSSTEFLAWEHYRFPTPGGGASDVIITTGFSGKINIQLQADDLPSIMDMDGDGDLDILCMDFSGSGQIEYHKNVSTNSSTPDYIRITEEWGGLRECGCGEFAFTNESCNTSGRTHHAGGKFLLALDVDANGATDLLFSESGCDSLYLFTNDGTTENAVFSTATVFPSKNASKGLYPTAFYEDVDFDNTKDLLLSYGVFERTDEVTDFSQSLQFFKNNGTTTQPLFSTNPFPLLQSSMIDVGENAVPAFFDFDKDGDEDLFIGSFGKLRSSGNFSSSLFLFENKGTQAEPLFELINEDYANLSDLNLYNLKPQFIDVSSDGKTDLVFTATNQSGSTTLYYITNTTQSGLQLEAIVNPTDITILFHENIHLTDVNNDGLVDLLIGKADGAVEYWRNTGSGNSPAWQLEDNAFLGLGASTLRQNPSLFTGFLNDTNEPDLVLTDQHGVLRILSDFNLQEEFSNAEEELLYNPLSKQFENRNLGGRIWVTSYSHSSGNTSLFVGNMLGGLQVLTSLRNENTFEVYPNPLTITQPLTIETLSAGTIQLFSTTGQLLNHFAIAKGMTKLSLPILQSGVYLLRFSSNGATLTRRLVIYQ